MHKVCSICKTEKPLDEFGQLKTSGDLKQKYCKICSRIKDQKHYAKSSNRKKAIRKNNAGRIQKAREYVIQYLSSHPCVDCTESDIIVLEFDHRADKVNSVTNLVKDGTSLGKIKKEIDKCDVRCANCHRKKTAKQLGYYKVV